MQKIIFTINKNETKKKIGFKTFNYVTMRHGVKILSRYKRPTGTIQESALMVKENAKTVLVDFDGRIIKRHKVKHNVEIEGVK